MTTPHIVIVGGSVAGVQVAMSARSHGFSGRLTIVDADPRVPYERPPLSKSTEAVQALVPIVPPETYAAQDVELRLGSAVARLDRDGRRVVFGNGDTLAADRVVLATGVSARRLGVPGEELAGVHRLRDADDAERLFHDLRSPGPLVIVGGGFIGLEAAAVARELDIDVTVVEMAELPLSRVLGEQCARFLFELHTRHGVRFELRRSVAAFGGAERVANVLLDDGRRLPAATVIVGAGVVPNDHLAKDAGITCAGGIVVDSVGRTSDDWVWAAGDVCVQPHPSLAIPGRIEHWDAALRHGYAVGASLAGTLTEARDAPYFWSDQYGRTLRMYGRGREGDEIVLRGEPRYDDFVAFWLRGGVVAAVAGLEQARTVRMGKALMDAGSPVSRDMLADPSADLRSVLRRVGAAS